MIVKDCDEETLLLPTRSKEDLERELRGLNKTLKDAFSQYERDEERRGNPKKWVDDVLAAIKRATCLLKTRNDHAELEEIFSLIDVSLQHARKRLSAYAKLWHVELPETFE